MNKTLALICLSAFLSCGVLSGCAARRGSPLDEYAGVDRGATIGQGVAVGAVGGAAVGAGIGAAIRGGKGARAGAAIGGLVGAIAGGAYGNYVANEKERIYRERKSIRARWAEIQSENERLAAQNQQIEYRIANLQKKIAEQQHLGAQNRAAKEELNRELASIKSSQEALEKQMITQMIRLGYYKENGPQSTKGGSSRDLLEQDDIFMKVNEQRKRNNQAVDQLKI